MKNKKLTPLAPRAPTVGPRNQPKTQEFPPEPRRARPPGRKSVFLRIELGPGRGHFFSRKRPQRHMDRKIFALRAPKDLGLRPPGSGDPLSNAHPVTLEAASPPSVARSGPPGPSRGRTAFCFCFLRTGPGPSEVAGGGPLTERSKTLAPAVTGMAV